MESSRGAAERAGVTGRQPRRNREGVPASTTAGTDAFVAEQDVYQLGHRVLRDPRPFHPQRLWDVYNRFLGIGIHRSKGFFWLPTRDELVLL